MTMTTASTSGSGDSTSPPRLSCILTNNVDEISESSDPLWLEQEEGKKSSFALNLASPKEVAKPAHVLVQQSSSGDTFVFGGLEILSNARNIEIYLTQDGKESYLTTSRGFKSDDKFKCLVVCPGGPRPVQRVHLKLLSIQPDSPTAIATLYAMKLKGRLAPRPQQQQASSAAPSEATAPSTSTNAEGVESSKASPLSASVGLSQGDMGAAMAGISMMVRLAESRLLESVTAKLDATEQRIGARLDRIEQCLLMQRHDSLVQQQQQQQTLAQMLLTHMNQQQTELTSLAASLREQLAKSPEQQHVETESESDMQRVPDERPSQDATSEGHDVPSARAIGNCEHQIGEATDGENVTPCRQASACEQTIENQGGIESNDSAHVILDQTACQVESVHQSAEKKELLSLSKVVQSCSRKKEADDGLSDASTIETNTTENCTCDELDTPANPAESQCLESDILNGEQAAQLLGDGIGYREGPSESLPDKNSDTSASPESIASYRKENPLPERRPVMETKEDPLELPDLLPES